MIVRFTKSARAELAAIDAWIARENPARARSFVLELRTACEELGDRAKLYPLVPGTRNLRKRLVSPYLIFYRAQRDSVLIVSIRHGARDNVRLR